jgi:hypothetical protein
VRRICLVTLAGVIWASSAVARSPGATILRARVLAFAHANVGRTVGNGECAGLAYQALKAAGAMPKAAHGYPGPRDYVWGGLVAVIEATSTAPRVTGSLAEVKPGDIAQFSNVRAGRAHFGHHTAIVTGITDIRLDMLEQHVGGGHVVVDGAIRLDRLSSGWIRFYQPVPAHR